MTWQFHPGGRLEADSKGGGTYVVEESATPKRIRIEVTKMGKRGETVRKTVGIYKIENGHLFLKTSHGHVPGTRYPTNFEPEKPEFDLGEWERIGEAPK